MGQPADASSDGFEELRELALNLRSVWNHRTDSLWERIDRELWEETLITWARG
jgi:starch phosphorylase